jgi:LysR family nitrogen assimilation transcriptional regulator
VTLSTRHLECFLSIAESGSFSSAAIRLGWSQPVLSRYAKELEEELKVRLLYRDGRGVVLTDAGRRFLTRATDLLRDFEEARRDAVGRPQQMLESASVGMPPTITRILALPLARAIYAAYPETQLRLIESFSGHLLEWLSNDRMDAAILYMSEATQRLNAEPLLLERLHLIAPAQQGPLPAELPLAEVARLPLILPSRPHGLRRQLDTIAMRNGLQLNVKVEADGLVPIVQLVAAGLGCTVLPTPSIQQELDAGLLTSALIVDPFVERSLVVAAAMKRSNRAGIETLIQIIKKQIKELDAETGWSVLRSAAGAEQG